MLDVNCDMKMRWETDILQLRSTKAWVNTNQDLVIPATEAEDSSTVLSTGDNTENAYRFEPLTEDEEWIDDVEFLRNLVRRETSSSGLVLKSLVGNVLRTTNPARFPHREAVQGFLLRALSNGVITETGEGALKMIHLPEDETTGMFPAISLSAQIPVSTNFLPDKVKDVAASSRPYIILIKWKFCPAGTTHPTSAFVQQKDAWGFFLFQKLVHAQRTVSEYPWLRNGILVGWRKVIKDTQLKSLPILSHTNPFVTNSLSNEVVANPHACSLCRAVRIDVELVPFDYASKHTKLVCPECKEWEITPLDQKKLCAGKVVQILEMMADNDDISVAENILRKQVYLRKEFHCFSRKYAALWIKSAAEMGLIRTIKSPQGKSKAVKAYLPTQFQNAMRPFPPDDMDTTEEIQFIIDILWNGVGWVDRKEIIRSLEEKFPRTMNHPYCRSKALLDGQQNGRLYVGKSPYGQVVGLKEQDTAVGLATYEPKESSTDTITNEGSKTKEAADDDDEESN